jgi:Ca2+-binding RTX toxin-like protein
MISVISVLSIAGVAFAKTERGTRGPDRLVGTKRADKLVGRAGRDKLIGRRGADKLLGGKGRDRLKGGRGSDLVKGGPANDWLKGGAGDDELRGNGGLDILRAGPGDDALFSAAKGGTIDGGPGADEFNFVDGEPVGGAGNDLIQARDGTEDEINCGDGEDTAVVDESEEGVLDCENLIEPSTTGRRR